MDIIIPCHRPTKNLSALLAEIIEKTEQPYRLHIIAHQESAAFNRNCGLNSCPGVETRTPVIMLDDDIRQLPLYWNRLLVQGLLDDPSVLAVSARLMTPDGGIGKNTANNVDLSKEIVDVEMIPTACCAFWLPDDISFDERYKAAGWEDTDFFRQIKEKTPTGKFVINNKVQVIHQNEEKNGGGAENTVNRSKFMEKWYSVKRFNGLKGITRRGCIDVGHICNIDCEMCYHRHEKKSERKFLSKEEIKKRMLRDREDFGLECIDFTGGEPTLHPDIVELVAYGREIGLPVCLISHGQWDTYQAKVQQIIDAKPYEFLLSIHGIEEDHNSLVNAGAYSQILHSITMLNENSIPWRANCVVTSKNYRNLNRYASEMIDLRYPPKNVNFIVFNPFSEWAMKGEIDFQERHSVIAPFISKAIEKFDSAKVWCNVRYFPLCILPSQEKHITCFPQIVYDPLEWDVRSYCDLGVETIESCYRLGRQAGIYGETDQHLFFNMWSLHNSQKIYRKPPACLLCRYRLICDGIAYQYRNRYGAGELKASEGELIRDPIYYRRGTPGVSDRYENSGKS